MKKWITFERAQRKGPPPGFELAISISSMRLTDVNRRSFYARATLGSRTYWLQWWPRPIEGKTFLSCGMR